MLPLLPKDNVIGHLAFSHYVFSPVVFSQLQLRIPSALLGFIVVVAIVGAEIKLDPFFIPSSA